MPALTSPSPLLPNAPSNHPPPAGATAGTRKVIRTAPAYGYAHPTCRLPPPAGVDAAQTLSFDLELLGRVPAADVRATGEDELILKIVKVESERWEMARPPNEVTFTLRAAAPAPGGEPGAGPAYFEPPAPLSAPLGAGRLPAGLEAALATMSAGERAVLVVPAATMAGGEGGVPAPPAGAEQVELDIELQQLVQVGVWD